MLMMLIGRKRTYCREKYRRFTIASKGTGLEVNVDKSKYMTMPRDQNAARSHNMNTESSSFERVEEFKYLGTTLTDQNSIQEEIKSRLKSGNACCYSVQNLLSCRRYQKMLRLKYAEL